MEEVSEVDDGNADRPAKQFDQLDNNIDESGIGTDLNESYNHTTCDIKSVVEISIPQDNLNVKLTDTEVMAMSADKSMVDAEDTSFNCSGMKKDDSGIYSERSPLSGLTKDVSDGDLTESITESFEENASLEQRCKNDSDIKDTDMCESKDLDFDENNRNSDANDKNTDGKDINNLNSNDINQQGDISEASGCVSHSQTMHENSHECLAEKEGNSKVTKHTGSKRLKSLVDYDTSDNDRDNSDSSGEDSQIKPRKCFRKRKSDSTENSDQNTDDENASNEDNDGTPVLLRHSEIIEPDIEHMSDIESVDSSDNEAKTKDESSESEPDETPMELSKFGPPKHKWRALFDLRDRERGFSMRSEPSYFRKKIQGSLQMVQRFDLQYKMEQHEGCVNALHFNRIGTLLASGSDDLNIVIWNWMKNKPALIYDSGHRSNVFQSKFMPFSGDCHVVSCARDGQIRLADLSSTGVCKGTKKLAQHRGAAHKLALEMDSPHVLLSCGEDAITFEIDLRCDKANRLVTTKENDRKIALYSIHSNPCNSNEFVVSGRDHFIRVYDKRKIKEDVDDGLFKKFCPHHLSTGDKPDTKANVTCACYNYNGTEVLGTYNDEDIYLFSNEHSDGANYIHKYSGHRNNQTVKGVNFYGAESEFIVSGSDCGHIFLWDKATENIVKFMEGDDGGVINVLEPHPFSPVLATSGLDHDIKIWAPTCEAPSKLNGLKKLTKRNSREREEERSSDGGMVDGAMLWYLMHHLRRGRRRREREARRARGESPAEDDDDDDTSDTLSDDDSHSDSDSETGPHERIQCAPS